MVLELSPGFLLASPSLLDPNFHRTVVLLVDHGQEGSLGFVINRPSTMMLPNMVQHLGFDEVTKPPNVPVMIGGPVAPDTGWIIFDQAGIAEALNEMVAVSESVAVSASRDLLETVVQGNGPERFMLVLGYAGWGAGQLDMEISRGAWIPADLNASIIFDTPFGERWTAALNSLGIDPARLVAMSPSEA